MALIDRGKDGVCLDVFASEVAQSVVLLGQVAAAVLAAQFAEGIQRGHDAGGVRRHGAVAPVHRPHDVKRLVVGRGHVEAVRDLVVVPEPPLYSCDRRSSQL